MASFTLVCGSPVPTARVFRDNQTAVSLKGSDQRLYEAQPFCARLQTNPLLAPLSSRPLQVRQVATLRRSQSNRLSQTGRSAGRNPSTSCKYEPDIDLDSAASEANACSSRHPPSEVDRKRLPSSSSLPSSPSSPSSLSNFMQQILVEFDRLCKEQWESKRLQALIEKAFRVASPVVLVAILIANGASITAQPAGALTEENLIFLEAWRTIDRAYVDKTFNGQSWFRYREKALKNLSMENREETYAAIRTMVATLDDEFTKFLEPDKFKSLRSGTEGSVTGVGLEVGFDAEGRLVVVAPVSGGPAEGAGVEPGDAIVEIDGESTAKMGLYEAAQRLQGASGSQVELTLKGPGFARQRTVALVRARVTLKPASWQVCETPEAVLGYIRLSTFNSNSAAAVRDAIRELKEQGATAFVMDMRNNSGGLFPAALEIAKMWLDQGVIVYIADSMGERESYEANGVGTLAANEPLTLLVNRGTASASEILAGALQDNKRATVLGTRTFGKGKIQSVYELSDGSGLAVTIARYRTPSHADIDKVGIMPDRPLPPDLPINGDGFCACVRTEGKACSLPVPDLLPTARALAKA